MRITLNRLRRIIIEATDTVFDATADEIQHELDARGIDYNVTGAGSDAVFTIDNGELIIAHNGYEWVQDDSTSHEEFVIRDWDEFIQIIDQHGMSGKNEGQMNIQRLKKIIREELEAADGHLDVELADPIYRALSDTLGSRSIVKNAYYNRDRRSGAINIINADGALYIVTAHELGEAGVGSREAIEWLAAHGAKQMDQTMIDRCTLNNANKRRFRSHRQWS